MSLQYRVISIGTLSRNRFWNESAPKRVSHATTVLIEDDSTCILVDPSLPTEVLAQRLDERSGLTPSDIHMVFLTNFRPIHRRCLATFSKATWFMYQPEMEAMQNHLDNLGATIRGQGRQDQDNFDKMQSDAEAEDLDRLVEEEQALLKRFKAADEKLTTRVHLFPCPGATPGSCGLLLASPTGTTIVAGDAIVTQEYFHAGRIFEQVYDNKAAQESFSDIMEVADEIIPGHDNLFRVVH